MRVLVEEMVRQKVHVLNPDGHFIPAPVSKKAKASKKTMEPRSAIANVMVLGAQVWQDGKFSDFLKGTTFDPALGYPISSESASNVIRPDSVFDTGTVFDQTDNPLDCGSYQDLHGDEVSMGNPGVGGLGGGDEFGIGDED
jgi:hypothetical protein